MGCKVLKRLGEAVSRQHSAFSQTSKVAALRNEIDVLVAHIIPKNVWYVLPIEDFAPARSLRFYPDIECRRAKWEGYREAWGLMRK
jgi:hypothetical protein